MTYSVRFRWYRFLHRCRYRYRWKLRGWIKRTFICRFVGCDWRKDGSWGWWGKTCNRCWLTVVEGHSTVTRKEP